MVAGCGRYEGNTPVARYRFYPVIIVHPVPPGGDTGRSLLRFVCPTVPLNAIAGAVVPSFMILTLDGMRWDGWVGGGYAAWCAAGV
jgi:hypothetical protein